MTSQHTSLVHVYYVNGAQKRVVGRLAIKERKIFFEYHPEFLSTGLQISPLKLPLKQGVIACEEHVFDGLFGVFNDSLPDGWGRLLLDRKLTRVGVNLWELSPLDRLCYVGNRGMGALAYEPEIKEEISFYRHSLDDIADEVLQFQETDDEQFIDELLVLNGSSAGARPKVLVTIQDTLVEPSQALSKSDWIIKFCSSFDPKDNGAIEYAYHLMAQAAHLHVPEAKLFPSKNGPGFFGVKRFDRVNENRFHMHTISGLLHADHRMPSLDYETILKATLWLTQDAREGEKLFRQAVFNLAAHNRDDHGKNFSYLMNEKGVWSLSPSYDLIFSSGPAGEHCSTIMGEGKTPTLTHLLKLADIGGINKTKALQIIDEVKSAISKWEDFARDAGVTKMSLERIQAVLRSVKI